MTPRIIHREGYVLTPDLYKGMKKPDNGDCVVMSAEIPAKDERGGDIVRVKGMKVEAGIPLLAQHMHRSADGSPTVIGRVDRAVSGEVEHKGKKYPAKLAAFTWADTDLANKYKQLWPDFLNKVSIGARVIDSEPLDKNNPYGGQDYKETDVFELSVVTIPGNPAAGVMRTIENALGEYLERGPEWIVAEYAERVNDFIKSHFEELKQSIGDRLDALEVNLVWKSESEAQETPSRNEQPNAAQVIAEALQKAGLIKRG